MIDYLRSEPIWFAAAVDDCPNPRSSAALAAKAATTNIPIVFAVATDPVAVGLSTGSPTGWKCHGCHHHGIEIAPK